MDEKTLANIRLLHSKLLQDWNALPLNEVLVLHFKESKSFMQFFSNIHIKPLQPTIAYHNRFCLRALALPSILAIICKMLNLMCCKNPNGILSDPLSVCRSLVSYIHNKQYTEDDLFYFNECWHSWQHHSRFSNPDKAQCLATINQSQQAAHEYLEKTDWLIITLGSSLHTSFHNRFRPN